MFHTIQTFEFRTVVQRLVKSLFYRFVSIPPASEQVFPGRNLGRFYPDTGMLGTRTDVGGGEIWPRQIQIQNKYKFKFKDKFYEKEKYTYTRECWGHTDDGGAEIWQKQLHIQRQRETIIEWKRQKQCLTLECWDTLMLWNLTLDSTQLHVRIYSCLFGQIHIFSIES